MNTERGFPCRTEGTPDDPLAFVGSPPNIVISAQYSGKAQ